ncbi:MAG: DUF547 domain-containing protein [Alphaproteobacteria bacterium]
MLFRPLGLAFFLLTAAVPALAAPAAELWPRWEKFTAGSAASVDHGAWNAFLATYVRPVDGVNLVDYGAVDAAAQAALDGYIQMLAATDIDGLDRPQQMALWINLYNAVTVRLIVDNYPLDSIRDLGGLFSSPWGKKLVTVAGEDLSLDDIEHRILRPIWRDPRIHYAVNCASVGCPNLAAEAYEAERLDGQLDAAARAYVNHPRGAEVLGDGLVVSKIYDWYQVDFGGSEAGVISHLKQFAAPPLAKMLTGVSGVADYRYDWALNDAPGGAG